MSGASWSTLMLITPQAGSTGGPADFASSAAIELRVRRARRLSERIIGLIGKPLPASGSALWLQPCMAVHTFGVRGAIDLLFVDRRGRIVRIFERVAPARIRGHWRARAVLELRAGEGARLGVRPGMQLRWIASGHEPRPRLEKR